MGEKEFKFWAFKLSGIMIVVFILQNLISGFTSLFVLDNTKMIEVWRFVSAIFLHGGLGHIAYNLFALLLFGSIVEKLIGSRKFLLVFFVTGILANVISVWFYPSSLGASGAIFGIIGALVVLRPGMTVWAFGMPMPMVVAGLLWAAGDVIGAVGYFSGNPLDNTGNIAHLSGMLFGLIFGGMFRVGLERQRRRDNVRISINEKDMQRWEEDWLR